MTKATIIRLVAGVVIGGGLGALMGYFGKCASGTCPLTANPFRGAIYGAVLGIVFSYSFKPQSNADSATATDPADTEKVKSESEQEPALIHIDNEEDFKRYILDADQPVLADFFSNSCPPCRMLVPVIENLAASYAGKAVVCKVNLDIAPNLAKPYGIRGIPAVLIFENGEEAERIVGYHRERAYKKILDHYIETEEKEN